jgi:steroid 5-alpha reductase family enzyme
VAKATVQQRMYGVTGRCLPQRATLTILNGCSLALAWWLLTGGVAVAGGWLGKPWQPGNPARSLALAVALTIYFVRVLGTMFVFLRRGMSWTEVYTITPWVLILNVTMALAGGTNRAGVGAAFMAGAALFVAGSWINSFAEYQRHRWKQRPENRGKLYTEGLFRLTRHPNYLGDLILFSGLSLMTGRWITGLIPALMLCGFVFTNIPALDAHLAEHYGAAFEDYALRTRKLIPFLY